MIGNVTKDDKLREIYEALDKAGKCEKVTITWSEAERTRLRKTADKGTDIGISLESGTVLRDGDVLYRTDEKIILVKVESVDVAVLTFKIDNISDEDLLKVSVKVGHTIGNLHRPIKVDGTRVIFPINSTSEIELLNKTLSSVADQVSVSQSRMIFELNEDAHTHEH